MLFRTWRGDSRDKNPTDKRKGRTRKIREGEYRGRGNLKIPRILSLELLPLPRGPEEGKGKGLLRATWGLDTGAYFLSGKSCPKNCGETEETGRDDLVTGIQNFPCLERKKGGNQESARSSSPPTSIKMGNRLTWFKSLRSRDPVIESAETEGKKRRRCK